MNILLALYNTLGKYRIKIPRLIDAKKELSLKRKNFPKNKLSKNQIENVKLFWGDIKPNLRYISLYNYNKENFDPRYIPDDLYYGTIDPYFNKAIDCIYLDNKNFYDLYFPDIKQPQTIARKNDNIYLNANYDIIDFADVISMSIKEKSVIIKKSIMSDGGQGVVFWNEKDGIEKLKTIMQKFDNIIIQKIVHQHQSIGKIHPSSINTIRVLSLIYNNKVHILSSIVRMGANGSNVDNGHSGGIFCGLDNEGKFKDVAYTYMTGDKYETYHPTTGVRFSECYVPNYTKLQRIIEKVAPRLSGFSKLTSWDFTVDENLEPTLIEVNLSYGGLFFHQISNGPVFGDLTKEIITDVVSGYSKKR